MLWLNGLWKLAMSDDKLKDHTHSIKWNFKSLINNIFHSITWIIKLNNRISTSMSFPPFKLSGFLDVNHQLKKIKKCPALILTAELCKVKKSCPLLWHWGSWGKNMRACRSKIVRCQQTQKIKEITSAVLPGVRAGLHKQSREDTKSSWPIWMQRDKVSLIELRLLPLSTAEIFR